jgi:hypothetical protein
MRLFALATLLSALLVAGCGARSSTETSTTAVAPTGSAAASAQPAPPGGIHEAALAFARCMRANGVPGFPDPSPGGGLLFPANSVNRSAPAFKAAQAKCRKLLPGGGPPLPGTTTHPTAQTLAKLLGIARCMRAHGVPDFPDPRTSVPADPFASGAGVITDYDGAILLFPSTLNAQSPAYARAAAACGDLAEKLGRGPHSRTPVSR